MTEETGFSYDVRFIDTPVEIYRRYLVIEGVMESVDDPLDEVEINVIDEVEGELVEQTLLASDAILKIVENQDHFICIDPEESQILFWAEPGTHLNIIELAGEFSMALADLYILNEAYNDDTDIQEIIGIVAAEAISTVLTMFPCNHHPEEGDRS